ncbi:MAG: VOC family protein [Steroidobacteraceae bacterium]
MLSDPYPEYGHALQTPQAFGLMLQVDDIDAWFESRMRFVERDVASEGSMAQVHQITPFLHVPDLESALKFFCDTLRFEAKFRESNYAYLELGGCGLRILEEPHRKLAPNGKARVGVYIDVANVDELHMQLRRSLGKLPLENVEPLQDKPWRQREFQVRMPDGDWLTFGQPVTKP